MRFEFENYHQEGVTPLINACSKGHSEIVRLLMAAGANHEAQDKVSFLV
jgi:ankyrin repeat protein